MILSLPCAGIIVVSQGLAGKDGTSRGHTGIVEEVVADC